jgi:hypothetical protein
LANWDGHLAAQVGLCEVKLRDGIDEFTVSDHLKEREGLFVRVFVYMLARLSRWDRVNFGYFSPYFFHEFLLFFFALL